MEQVSGSLGGHTNTQHAAKSFKDLHEQRRVLEIKETRVQKGWVRKGEKYCCPMTGEHKDLTHDNLRKSLRQCEEEIKKTKGGKHSKSLAVGVNIVITLLVLSGIGWYSLNVGTITGYAVAEAFEEATPTPTPAEVRERLYVAEEKDIRTDNHPPAFSGLDTLKVEGETILDLGKYVKDPDNDELTFISTQPDGLHVAWDEHEVKLTPQKAGEGVITFIASDDLAMAKQEVKVTFKPAP